VQRPDDREEVIGPRLQAYEKQTAPLAAYYRRLGCFTTSTRQRASKKWAARCSKAFRAYAELASRRGEDGGKEDGDSSAKRGRAGEDAPRRACGARSPGGAAGCSEARANDDGPREACRGKNRQRARQGAFKGYRGYPCVLCTSVNSEIVHGIPSPKRKLREGDIVSIDFGMEVDGYYADSAVTVPVGASVQRCRSCWT